MFFVYMLNSLKNTDRMYVGYTQDLQKRLHEHNSGECIYTVRHKPWKLCAYLCFDSQDKALAFESYLKSGSGRSFAKRHF